MDMRTKRTVYSLLSSVILWGSFIVILYFANEDRATIDAIIGFIFSIILAPAIHEVGHIAFGSLVDMECVYVKFFCFQAKRVNGEMEPSFVIPFDVSDQTQMIPTKGGDMKRRASLYTLGGLIFSLAILTVIVFVGIVLSVIGYPNYLLWGLVPYILYLLVYNIAPVEYESGKTDALVFSGIENGEASEQNMLAAMEIQGQLYEGKSFAEIDETLFLANPQLCEDEPLFAVMLDLKYRYYMEKGDMRMAADCLNRLAQAQEYIPNEELQKIAAEFVYMHSIKGNKELALESAKSCKRYLRKDTSATRNRIMAAFALVKGEDEQAKEYKETALQELKNERIKGVAKFEEILIERIA